MQKLEDGEMLTTAEVETLAGALEAATQAEEAAETVQQEEAAPAEKKPMTSVEAIVRAAQGKVGNESEKLNIDNAANRNYTENINSNEQGGVPNDGNRVDRGMVEGVSGGQRVSGNSQEGRAWSSAEDGRGSQGFSRRDLTQSAYSLPIKKNKPHRKVWFVVVDDTRLELVTSRTSSGCATSCANRPFIGTGYCTRCR